VFDKSAFDGVGRGVVPASGWYEWTGASGRKTAWRITRKDGALLWFAAICDVWTAPGGLQVMQVATVTCAPSADVRAIHDRMGVILEEGQIGQWLGADAADAKTLLNPYPDGRLQVAPAADVDWTAS
jgi:putative SOS response-associated peptidase YedK